MAIENEVPQTPEQRKKAIQSATADIIKDHGKGAIVNLHDKADTSIPVIPTGIYEVDYNVLGVGGIPRGRIIEIFGPESGGKTTTALTIVASAQQAGGVAGFIDVEHALDPFWAKIIGVNMSDLIFSQPDYGEQALQIAERLILSNAFDVLVVDSVAALVPKAELDGEIGDSIVGVHARMMSQAMRKFAGIVRKSNTSLVFINQIREKIGVMFGSPETTTGGRALKFYASIRLDVRRIGAIKDGDTFIGNKVKVKCTKNKVAAPFREAEIDLLFDRGYDTVGSVLDAAVQLGIVEKAGSWFSYRGERIGQGRNNATAFIRDNNLVPGLLEKVHAKARTGGV